MSKFMIGQRVIYSNTICIVCPTERICRPENSSNRKIFWINNPSKGYRHWVSESNLKPLPNGQL